MTPLLAGTALLLLCLQAGFLWSLARRTPAEHPGNSPLEARVIVLEEAVKRLPAIWQEDVDRANRHRARAEAAERRHRRQLEEGGELEPAGELVHSSNGNGSAGPGVPAVHSPLDAGQPPLALIHDQMMRARMDPFGRTRK